MNTPSQHNALRIRRFIIALVLLAGLSTALPAFATPGCGVSTEFITSSTGIHWDKIRASTKSLEDAWRARIGTQGASDLYVVRNTFTPFSHTGWHSHPGISLVMIISGTVAVYDGDDPTCTPQFYSAGSSFVDPSSAGHVHLLRNESATEEAVTVAVQLVPAGAARRIDSPDPGFCQEFICP